MFGEEKDVCDKKWNITHFRISIVGEILKARMIEQLNIVHHSLYENDRSNQDWAPDTSSIIIRDTDCHPV